MKKGTREEDDKYEGGKSLRWRWGEKRARSRSETKMKIVIVKEEEGRKKRR